MAARVDDADWDTEEWYYANQARLIDERWSNARWMVRQQPWIDFLSWYLSTYFENYPTVEDHRRLVEEYKAEFEEGGGR